MNDIASLHPSRDFSGILNHVDRESGTKRTEYASRSPRRVSSLLPDGTLGKKYVSPYLSVLPLEGLTVFFIKPHC